MGGGAEHHRFTHAARGVLVGQHQGRGAVGDRRAIGALERTGDDRVLLAFAPAEFIAEILAHLGIGIADAILVVLRRDHRERVGLIAVFLKIQPGDASENTGEAAVDIGLLTHVGGLEQVPADLGARCRRHLLDADHQRDPCGLCCDRLQGLVHCRRTGGAGILHPGRALEAQVRCRLQHQGGGKILGREPGIEMAEQDIVDVSGRYSRIGQCIGCHPYDQALNRVAVAAAERRMRPSNNAGGHRDLLIGNSSSNLIVPNFRRFLLA